MTQSPAQLPSSERILRALNEARSQLAAVAQTKNERVAIVGMAGRFPGAESVAEFWDLLKEGRSGIRYLSPEELRMAGVSETAITDPHYIPAYASFAEPTQFDAGFFGYSPAEAKLIDPQQRVFLECAWTALEDAGYDPQQSEDDIGVFGGAALNRYIVNLQNNTAIRESTDVVQAVVSNVLGLMPTRVSYKLNLTGPSCGIQTGCSTALVAIHTACQSLLNQECDLALAGGVTISQPIPQGYWYQPDSIAAPDGVCRAFDAQGKGTLFGNGVGIVVLKRLSAAIADRDHIYAVIKGSAINNDGADKVSLTAPSVSGQAAVIKAAIAKAGIEPETIGYVEGHGTGTPLGDPIEVAALNKAFGPARQKSCALGSVKSNIGHLDAAAGAAGLMKTVLALQNKTLPPSLNYGQPNPQIDFGQGPFFVNQQCRAWQTENERPRRAGVSSFGMGGTNAHLILEEAPALAITPNEQERPWQVLPLSGKTQTALEKKNLDLASYLESSGDLTLADVAYTLQVGRQAFAHRRVCIAQSLDNAVTQLNQSVGSWLLAETIPAEPPSVVFMFSGQGSQYAGMAKDLYKTEPVFQAILDECDRLLAPEISLLALIFGESDLNINGTTYAQPALFAVEYALAKLWQSWGVKPNALIGHSIGEYVAACVAGVFSLADGLKLVQQRGELMQSCEPGSMLAVMQSVSAFTMSLPPAAEIAVVNSPKSFVISGPTPILEALNEQLDAQGIPCRLLQTSHGFHSAAMEPILEQFAQVVGTVTLQPPTIDLISNVSGTWLSDHEAISPDYWVKHLRQNVQFSTGIQELLTLTQPVFLEIGPGNTLTKLAQQHGSPQQPVTAIPSLAHPRDNQSDAQALITAIGKFWLAGGQFSWTEFQRIAPRQRLSLPTYPFERESFWVEPDPLATLVASAESTVNKSELQDWFYLPSWSRRPLTQTTSTTLNDCWLVFADRCDHKFFAEQTQKIIWTLPGTEFTAGSGEFTVVPDQPDDYKQLLQKLEVLEIKPSQVVYAWNRQADGTDIDGLRSLKNLVQALAGVALTQDLTLSVVVEGLFDVTGGEEMRPEKAALLGVAQVLTQEYPGLGCRVIDRDNHPRTESKMAAELATDYDPSQRILAYRNGQRWVQDYRALSLPESQPELLRSQKTYLIAGDLLEGLGLVYAKALREEYDAKLILIGRPGLPATADWDGWLDSHSPHHSISRFIQQLKDLGIPGEDYGWFSGDLSDFQWLSTVLTDAQTQFGPIHGVFHADVMGDQASCLLADLDDQSCDRITRNKIRGLQTLQDSLQEQPAFYVLQSSLSAIVGGVGFGAYAGANCHLDTIAQQQTQQTQVPRWLSLNWDAVDLDGATETAPAALANSALMARAITPSEIWEVTRRALSVSDCAQLVVSPRPLAGRIQTAFTPVTGNPEEAAPASQDPLLTNVVGPTIAHPRPQLTTDYVEPRTDIEMTVAQEMGKLLGIEQIGIHDNFFELGGHSLMAIQAVTRLRQTYQVDLPIRAFLFEAPTVAGIAKIIEQNQVTFTLETQSTLENLLDEIESSPPEKVE
ncbi:MAG: beta-ketoacyl synthase N-terminal-like domain-containing protein [Cyanobacteria bacterium P01_H01_bin.15]